MHEYEPFGPFKIPLDEYRRIDVAAKKAKGTFWTSVENEFPGLSNSHGIYVFGIRAGRGIRPWYVGQAKGKNGFMQEVFTHHKIDIMNGVLAKSKKGTLILHFIARQTAKGKFSEHVNTRELDYLEVLLMGIALRKNQDLSNIKSAGMLRDVRIPGVLHGGGRGRKTNGRSTLKTALGIG